MLVGEIEIHHRHGVFVHRVNEPVARRGQLIIRDDQRAVTWTEFIALFEQCSDVRTAVVHREETSGELESEVIRIVVESHSEDEIGDGEDLDFLLNVQDVFRRLVGREILEEVDFRVNIDVGRTGELRV